LLDRHIVDHYRPITGERRPTSAWPGVVRGIRDDLATPVSALLGLDGLVLRAQVLDEVTAEGWLAVETTATRGWCPGCGMLAVGRGRRRAMVRVLPLADRQNCSARRRDS
jgi:hypothetical protein